MNNQLIICFILYLINACGVFGLEKSNYWPSSIRLIDAGTHSNIDGNSVNLRAGERGILQRVENGQLLLDYGRDGLFWLKPEATDYYTGYGLLESGQVSKQFPNLTGQIGNKLVNFKNPKGSHVTMDLNVSVKNYIIFYVDTSSKLDMTLLNAMKRFLATYDYDRSEVRFLYFLSSLQGYLHVRNLGLDMDTLTPHMRQGYIDALHQQPAPKPSFVISDAEGQILARSDTIDLHIERTDLCRPSARFGRLYRQVRKQNDRKLMDLLKRELSVLNLSTKL